MLIDLSFIVTELPFMLIEVSVRSPRAIDKSFSSTTCCLSKNTPSELNKSKLAPNLFLTLTINKLVNTPLPPPFDQVFITIAPLSVAPR